jgi:hypothetical protein
MDNKIKGRKGMNEHTREISLIVLGKNFASEKYRKLIEIP